MPENVVQQHQSQLNRWLEDRISRNEVRQHVHDVGSGP